MTSMREAMVELARALGVEIIWPDDRMPTPDELRSLPATHLLERDLTMRKERVEALANKRFGLGHEAATTQLRVAERHVRWGWLRDEIVLRWNDDCRCYGDGKMILDLELTIDDVAAGRSTIDAWYCPCQAGDALRAGRAKALRVMAEQRTGELAARIFEQAGAEYAEYRDVSLQTYTDRLTAYPPSIRESGDKLVTKLTDWLKSTSSPWLVLAGKTGSAKTGLSISLLRMLALRDQRGLIVREKALLDRIRATYDRERGSDAPSESDVLEELRGVPALVIDDMGAPGSAVSEWAQGQLFDVLNARYSSRRRTLITTNLEASEGDDLPAYLGERIWSRLVERTEQGRWLIAVNEPDLRRGAGVR